jgi:hypothetical protein
MNSTTTTTCDGHIAAYVTDAHANRIGWIFQRGFHFHVVLMDDRFSDDEINHPYDSIDDAQFAGFVAQHIFDTMDAESRIESEERMESTVEFWDSLAACA